MSATFFAHTPPAPARALHADLHHPSPFRPTVGTPRALPFEAHSPFSFSPNITSTPPPANRSHGPMRYHSPSYDSPSRSPSPINSHFIRDTKPESPGPFRRLPSTCRSPEPWRLSSIQAASCRPVPPRSLVLAHSESDEDSDSEDCAVFKAKPLPSLSSTLSSSLSKRTTPPTSSPTKPQLTKPPPLFPSSLTPATRPAPLSLTDLNAPQPKRRSIDMKRPYTSGADTPPAASTPTLPKFVLTPPVVARSRFAPGRSRKGSVGRSAHPFNHATSPVKSPPRARLAHHSIVPSRPVFSTPAGNPPNTEDWAYLKSHSESMTRLSLYDDKDLDRDINNADSPESPSVAVFGGAKRAGAQARNRENEKRGRRRPNSTAAARTAASLGLPENPSPAKKPFSFGGLNPAGRPNTPSPARRAKKSSHPPPASARPAHHTHSRSQSWNDVVPLQTAFNPKGIEVKGNNAKRRAVPRESLGVGSGAAGSSFSFDAETTANFSAMSGIPGHTSMSTAMTSFGTESECDDGDKSFMSAMDHEPSWVSDSSSASVNLGGEEHKMEDMDASVDSNDPSLVTPFFPGPSSGWPASVSRPPPPRPAHEIAQVNESPSPADADVWDGAEDMDSFMFSTLAARRFSAAAASGTLPGLGLSEVGGSTMPESGLPSGNGKKMMPDTPIKKGVLASRMWKSTCKAVAGGGGKFVAFGKSKGAPRKSLPVKFPDLSRSYVHSPETDRFPHSLQLVGNKVLQTPTFSPYSNASSSPTDPSPSPSIRGGAPGAPRKSYSELGLGKPDASGSGRLSGLFTGPHLLRRTSSSAYSAASSDGGMSDGSLLGTPTRRGAPGGLADWRLPPLSRTRLVPASGNSTPDSRAGSPVNLRQSVLQAQRSPSDALFAPGASSSPSGSPISSPSFRRHSRHLPRPSQGHSRRLSSRTFSPGEELDEDEEDDEDYDEFEVYVDRERQAEEMRFGVKDEPGRFEREFVCVDRLGAGTFGQAFVVREKEAEMTSGDEDEDGAKEGRLYAVKRSKMYEGVKHRLRLLEEVEILRHLTNTTTTRRRSASVSSLSSFSPQSGGEHGSPNVLHFIAGWEQDQMLYIQTELCELGNLAEFLLTFGTTYNRLDESRLWKIMAELSNGLLHIHHSNVIHMDIKPANIFITVEGRLRIGDFGMASRWPRPAALGGDGDGFDREGDREYMAPEILNGVYGREADIFSFGMTMLECAGNIVVPDMGEPWHRLRSQDFSDIDLSGLSSTLLNLIFALLSSEPSRRPAIEEVWGHDVVRRTRAAMRRNMVAARRGRLSLGGPALAAQGDTSISGANQDDLVAIYRASAFGSEPPTFLAEVLGEPELMDVSP